VTVKVFVRHGLLRVILVFMGSILIVFAVNGFRKDFSAIGTKLELIVNRASVGELKCVVAIGIPPAVFVLFPFTSFYFG
jgi:hypothetical protein